jgi:hypothetical protein
MQIQALHALASTEPRELFGGKQADGERSVELAKSGVNSLRNKTKAQAIVRDKEDALWV